MSTISGPEVRKALEGMAADLAKRSPVRRLWVFRLAGLTPALIFEAAKAAGFTIAPEKTELAWHDLSIATGEHWRAMRDYCVTRLGLDPEEFERPDLSKLPAYQPWLAERRRWQAENGVVP